MTWRCSSAGVAPRTAAGAVCSSGEPAPRCPRPGPPTTRPTSGPSQTVNPHPACWPTTAPLPWDGSALGREPASPAWCAHGTSSRSTTCRHGRSSASTSPASDVARASLAACSAAPSPTRTRTVAPAIEGYARDATDSRLSADVAYPGTVRLFEAAGFREVARYLPPAGATARVTMRLELDATSTTT